MSCLKIEVIEGRNLMPVASDGTSDPYVVCIVGNKQKKTKTIKNTLNPKWRIGSQSETFTFKKVSSKVKEIIVRCFDHNWLSSADRLGQIKIPISEVEDGKERDEWYKLQPQKPGDQVSGELRLKIQLVSEKTHRTSVSSGELTNLPLLALIRKKSLPALEEALKSDTVDINATDQFGECALHWAAASNDLSATTTRILVRLLEHPKVNVNIANIDGNTPLHIFCKKFCAPDIERPFKLFIQRGANVNGQNNSGETPLHQAVFNLTMSQLMVTHLIKNGANINLANNKGETPLYYAVRMGATQLVSFLIRNGADIGTPKGATVSPFDVAIEGGFPKIADILKDTKEMIDWLEKIGMGKYKNIFLENELRVYLLSDVTKEQWAKWIPNEKDRKVIIDTINKTAATEKYTEKKEKIQKDRQIRRHESNLRKTLQQSALLSRSNRPSSSNSLSQSSQNEISNLTENWEIDPSDLEYTQSLGSGASGEVFRGYYKGEEVAIKVLKSSETEKEIEEFKKEFAILIRVREPHVVHLYGAGIKGRLLMVMEFCHRGSLYDVLRDESIEFGWDRFFHFAIEVVTAVSELHRNNVLHRDLKTLNLLVTEDWQIRICDFGLSRFDTATNINTLQKCRGTYPYIAPEVYNCERFVPQSDVYAIGIILWEMANRVIKGKYEKPFSEYKQFQFDFQILIQACTMNLRPTIPPQCPSELADLIKQCWLPDKNARPTTDQLLEKLNALKEQYKQNVAEWDQIRAKKSLTMSSSNNSNSSSSGSGHSSNDPKAVELKASSELPVKENGPHDKNNN